MLYEYVKKILEKGTNDGKDVLVARDVLINEEPEKKDEYFLAGAALKHWYDDITEMWRNGDLEGLKEFCEGIESED